MEPSTNLINTGHTRAPDPRRMPRTQQRVWRALRVLKRDLDIPHLALVASAPETSTGDYIRLLVRAGYLIVVHNGGRHTGNITKYRLVRDTGPLAPRRALTVMLDPNTDEVFDLPHRHTPRYGRARAKQMVCLDGLAA